MKPQRDIVAERPLACHCPELLGPAEEDEDAGEKLAALGAAFARLIAPRLAPMLGGTIPRVTCTAPEASNGEKLTRDFTGLSASYLLHLGDPGGQVVLHVTGAIVLALTDRIFGGNGVVEGDMPESFPASADLACTQLGKLLQDALALAHGGGTPSAVALIRQASQFRALRTLPGLCECYSLRLQVEEPGRDAWFITLATRTNALPLLLAESRPVAAEPRPARHHRPSDEPFANIPLTLRAMLAQRSFPASRLAALKPGDLLPLPMPRDVPLLLGDTEIARGTIGTMDDRVAIRIPARRPDISPGDL